MRKKFKFVLMACLSFVVLCFSPLLFSDRAGAKASASAFGENLTNEQIQTSILEELENFIEYGVSAEYKERASRVPGSKAEYNSAMYIHSELKALTNFLPVDNASTTDGIERFEFTSDYDGMTYTSQNIIFKRTSVVNSGKKIIIGAHYDTSYVYNQNTYNSGIGLVQDGVSDNAGSVALLLALVKSLDGEDVDLGFDIEVVFFGASTNGYDGSKYYTRGLSDADAKNTLLYINLDKIAVGKYNYMYVNESVTSQQEYMFNLLGDSFGFKELKNINCLDFNTSSANGLSYTHIGLESDHAMFMARNINVVNFFSGDYENALTYGYSEYLGKNNITFSENDSYSYLLENVPEFTGNLVNVYKAISTLISDNNFISEMEKDNGLSEWYAFWTNDKLAVFITAVLLIVFMFVYYLLYHHLLAKSKKKISEGEIEKIVLKITTNLGEDDSALTEIIDQKVKSDTNKDEGKNKDQDE